MTEQDEAVAKKAAKERRSQILWAYVAGATSILGYLAGLEATFLPMGFGVVGLILCYQLNAKGEPRHAGAAAALSSIGIVLWAAYNLAGLKHYFGM
jgi:hypothetical protein